MAECMTIQLYQPAQAHAALMTAWAECIKPMLTELAASILRGYAVRRVFVWMGRRHG